MVKPNWAWFTIGLVIGLKLITGGCTLNCRQPEYWPGSPCTSWTFLRQKLREVISCWGHRELYPKTIGSWWPNPPLVHGWCYLSTIWGNMNKVLLYQVTSFKVRAINRISCPPINCEDVPRQPSQLDAVSIYTIYIQHNIIKHNIL